MKRFYYYRVIRKTIVQTLDIFNDIQIIRYNKDGSFRKKITVPLKLGTKKKVWYWINERNNNQMLPIMSMSLDSIEFASDRVGNKIHNVRKDKQIPLGRLSRFINPTPYNFGFTLTIWSENMVDIDQILEQILPYFSPNIHTRVKIPELDVYMNLKVTFQGCSPDITMDMPDDDYRIIKWTLNFSVQGYLFQALKISGQNRVIDEDGVVIGYVCPNNSSVSTALSACPISGSGNVGIVCPDGVNVAVNSAQCSAGVYIGTVDPDDINDNEKMIYKIIQKYYAHSSSDTMLDSIGTETSFTSGTGINDNETFSTATIAIPPYLDSEGNKLYRYESFD